MIIAASQSKHWFALPCGSWRQRFFSLRSAPACTEPSHPDNGCPGCSHTICHSLISPLSQPLMIPDHDLHHDHKHKDQRKYDRYAQGGKFQCLFQIRQFHLLALITDPILSSTQINVFHCAVTGATCTHFFNRIDSTVFSCFFPLLEERFRKLRECDIGEYILITGCLCHQAPLFVFSKDAALTYSA